MLRLLLNWLSKYRWLDRWKIFNYS